MLSLGHKLEDAPYEGIVMGFRFSLKTLLLLIGFVGVWLGVIQFLSGSIGMLILIAPFFALLYCAYQHISKPNALAIAFVGLHTMACICSMTSILLTTDGVERWVRSMPIILIDLPVTLPLAFWQPPGIMLPTYVFVFGSLFWAIVGWNVARDKRALAPKASD